MEKGELEAYIAKGKDEQISLLETLGRIPAPSHHEQERALFVRDWFLGQGIMDVEIDQAKNVICFLGPESGPVSVFAAHTDVVFPDTTPLPMSREGSILRAPGIGDDTANLVNLMLAGRWLARQNLKHRVLLVANACEEGLGNLEGTKALFGRFGARIGHFISFDGYLGLCTHVPVGSHRWKVTISVQGGHSFRNFGRDNAIVIMASLITDLYGQHLPSEEKTTYNVGTIEGGSTVNSIAQSCSMLYEYRSGSEACLKTMREQFERIIDRYRKAGKQVEVELIGVRPGMGNVDRKELEAFTRRNAEIVSRHVSGELDQGPHSTDANIPLSLGITANTIGTVKGDLAHTREEWIDVDSLPAGLSIALEVMAAELAG